LLLLTSFFQIKGFLTSSSYFAYSPACDSWFCLLPTLAPARSFDSSFYLQQKEQNKVFAFRASFYFFIEDKKQQKEQQQQNMLLSS